MAAQRPPVAAVPSSANAGGGGVKSEAPSSMGGKKSFRRNDLKVGVPVPTYVQPPAFADGNSTAQGLMSAPIVTPHGSIHLLSKTRSTSGLLASPPGYTPLAGSALWGQPSAGTRSSPRWSQNSPAMMREDSQWGDSAAGFQMLRNDSLLDQQYSPLSGEMKSPTTRSSARLHSARDHEGGLLSSMGGGGMASAGPAGLVRRTSGRQSFGGGPNSASGLLSAGPFGRNTPPVSPLVRDDGVWASVGLVDPAVDPDGIFNAKPSWAK